MTRSETTTRQSFSPSGMVCIKLYILFLGRAEKSGIIFKNLNLLYFKNIILGVSSIQSPAGDFDDTMELSYAATKSAYKETGIK